MNRKPRIERELVSFYENTSKATLMEIAREFALLQSGLEDINKAKKILEKEKRLQEIRRRGRTMKINSKQHITKNGIIKKNPKGVGDRKSKLVDIILNDFSVSEQETIMKGKKSEMDEEYLERLEQFLFSRSITFLENAIYYDRRNQGY